MTPENGEWAFAPRNILLQGALENIGLARRKTGGVADPDDRSAQLQIDPAFCQTVMMAAIALLRWAFELLPACL
jgi:hypothetical protein